MLNLLDTRFVDFVLVDLGHPHQYVQNVHLVFQVTSGQVNSSYVTTRGLLQSEGPRREALDRCYRSRRAIVDAEVCIRNYVPAIGVKFPGVHQDSGCVCGSLIFHIDAVFMLTMLCPTK